MCRWGGAKEEYIYIYSNTQKNVQIGGGGRGGAKRGK